MSQRTLEELEGEKWGEPTYNTYLVKTVHRLRQKPITEFDTEDLRIMIGQNVGLPYLVPLALERLECELFAAGHYYPGDLLGAVLRADRDFWSGHRPELQRATRLAQHALQQLPELDTTDEIRTELSDLARRLVDFADRAV